MKVCPVCGKEFEAKRSSRVYCGDECYLTALKERNKINFQIKIEKKRQENPSKCKMCGKDFILSTRNKRYCSDECKEKAKRERKTEQKRNQIKKPKEPVACAICGTMFIPASPRSRCCSSEECKKEYNRRRLRKWKDGQREQRYCVVCGKRFESHRVDSVCCSDSCKKKKYKAEEEGRAVRMSHIDDVERHARATGRRYADIQKLQTLAMVPKIDVNIGGFKK